MTAKLSLEQLHELERTGDEPLAVENPYTHRVYVLVDTERFEVIRRTAAIDSGAKSWTDEKNDRRCALVHKKFTQGISGEEAAELIQLQDELATYRKHVVPLPYDAVDSLQAALNASPPTAPRPL